MLFKKEICFQNFRKCLSIKEPIYKKQNLLGHKIMIYTLSNKIKTYDDKEFILENDINTLAWGHYKIQMEKINL